MISLKATKGIFIACLAGILYSCSTTENIGSIEVEILKPAPVSFHGEFESAAIFIRDLYHTRNLDYFFTDNLQTYVDSTYDSKKYAIECVGSLEEYFIEDKRFSRVDNYADSLMFKESNTFDYKTLHEHYKADLLIFLDLYQTTDHWLTDWEGIKHANMIASLAWTVSFKQDTNIYLFSYVDTLLYNHLTNPEIFSGKDKRTKLLENAANYLGKSFGEKLLPYWLIVNRMYYRSNNPDMLRAEQLALKGNWLKAAEIWKEETQNKNINIAAKATYNMALACEMEGKLDLAIDWLLQSYKAYQYNPIHASNCQKYINILVNRKREIKQLEYQKISPD